ncbi:MAG: TrmH family RNA methyltransferase [Anaerolineales bacterium]
MRRSTIEFRECCNPNCGLRYPRSPLETAGERCPRCLGETRLAAERLWGPEADRRAERATLPLQALLDNVRSAWNVGAIFRTADGLGLQKLYLCGITPTPPHAGIRKTALGAEEWVEWEYAPNAVQLAKKLKAEGARLWGIEEGSESDSLEALREESQRAAAAEGWARSAPSSPIRRSDQVAGRIGSEEGTELRGHAASIVLILGNEIAGVDPELLQLCEKVIAIPMRGQKRSLNVEVAFALAAWEISLFLRR